MKHVRGIFTTRRQNQIRFNQQRVVQRRDSSPSLIIGVEKPQLYSQNSCLQLVQSRVPTAHVAHVAFGPSVLTQTTHLIGEFSIVCSHCTRIANRAEIFCRIKTEAGEIAPRADAFFTIRCAVSLSAVFNDSDPMSRRYRKDRPEIGGLTVEVNRDDGPCAWRDCGLESRRIESEIVWF